MYAQKFPYQTEDAMTRFQRWALRMSALTFSVLLMTACGSEEQADKSLDSPEWQEYRTLAMRYDSMTVAFQKREREDPEFAANPNAVAGAEIQKFYALTQQLTEAVPEDIKDLTDAGGYGIDDLRTLRLAAAMSQQMKPFLAVNKELIEHVQDRDSLLNLKLEIAQIAVMSGLPEQAEEYATEEVLQHAEPMNRAALYAGLSEAALDKNDFESGRTWALKAVTSYGDVARAEEEKGQANPQMAMYISNQVGSLIAPLMYEYRETGNTEGMDALITEVRGTLPESAKWEDVESSMNTAVAEIAKEREALDKPAPTWAEHAWIGSDPLSIEKLKGKVVLIDFFATWCQPCIRAFPKLRDWQETYGDDGLVVVGLTTYQGRYEGSQVEPQAEMDKLTNDFIPKHEITWPVGVEKNGRQTMQDYNVQGIPQIVLLDREGKVQYVKVGAADYDKTEAKIKQLLEE